MSDNNKKPKTLSWDDFTKLGNPENVPEINDEDEVNINFVSIIRIHLEKKGRGGKTVSIIKGVEAEKPFLKELTKELKSRCGVGGSLKEDDIIIQGDRRGKIRDILLEKGFTNVKLAGG